MGIKQTRQQRARIPAGMPRQKLKVDGLDPGMRGYWAKESQFSELQDAGYTFVSNSDDLTIGEDNFINKSSIISRPASRTTEEKLFLMQISKDFYQENCAIKQAQINETEKSMMEPQATETSYSLKGNRNTMETLGA